MNKAQRKAVGALALCSWRHKHLVPGRRRPRQRSLFPGGEASPKEQDRINDEGLKKALAVLGLTRREKDKS